MINPLKRTVAIVAALAMMAAPALSCCLGLMSHAHASTAVSAHTGHMSGWSMRDHCTGAETGRAAAPAHDEGCGGCAPCDGVQSAAKASLTQIPGLLTQVDFPIFAAIVRSRHEFVAGLLRATGPPLHLLIVHRTPVRLNTTLRL